MGKVGKREEIEQWLKLIGSTYMTEWRGVAKPVKYSVHLCLHVCIVEYCLMYEKRWSHLYVVSLLLLAKHSA